MLKKNKNKIFPETLGVGSSIQSAMCDVVWDKPFVGASSLDGLCPERRGYRIPQYSLLKLGKYYKKRDEKETAAKTESVPREESSRRQILSNGQHAQSNGSRPT